MRISLIRHLVMLKMLREILIQYCSMNNIINNNKFAVDYQLAWTSYFEFNFWWIHAQIQQLS